MLNMTVRALCGTYLARNSVGVWYSTHSRIRKFDFRNPNPEEEVMSREPEKPSSSVFHILPLPEFSVDVIRMLTAPIDMRSSKVSSWWKRKSYEMDIHQQRDFVRDNTEVLGRELAIGQFVVTMGGSVRFAGKPWMKMDTKKSPLPSQFEAGWILEGIDITDIDLYYEGFQNFHLMNELKVFIACDSPHLDDWCLDLISSEMINLETLDLTGCKSITWRGLQVIQRLMELKTLRIGNIPALENAESKLTCIELVNLRPELNIEGLNYLDF